MNELSHGRKRDFNALVIVHGVSAIPPTQVHLLLPPFTYHRLFVALIIDQLVAEPPKAYWRLEDQRCIWNQELNASWELGEDFGREQLRDALRYRCCLGLNIRSVGGKAWKKQCIV